MFTCNTMQSFIAVLGMEPLDMVVPPSDDPRRLREFRAARRLPGHADRKGIRRRDRARARCGTRSRSPSPWAARRTSPPQRRDRARRRIDLGKDVISEHESNTLSYCYPSASTRAVRVYSTVDIDVKGGLQTIVKQLDAGSSDGSCVTCTGETLATGDTSLPPGPDHEVIHRSRGRSRRRAACASCAATSCREAARSSRSRAWRGDQGWRLHRPGARLQQRASAHHRAREGPADVFVDDDMVVVRYEGPRGAPGMPELLDPTSRITALRRRGRRSRTR